MSEPTTQEVPVGRIQRVQTLQANVFRACKNCGAPGYWHAVPGVNEGCYDPEKFEEARSRGTHASVGKTCPQCGAPRVDVEARGVIWRKVWKASLWKVLKETLRDSWRSTR